MMLSVISVATSTKIVIAKNPNNMEIKMANTTLLVATLRHCRTTYSDKLSTMISGIKEIKSNSIDRHNKIMFRGNMIKVHNEKTNVERIAERYRAFHRNSGVP